MTTTPLTAVSEFALTPMAYMEVVTACMTNAPMMLASKENRPPEPNMVPPMTTARMASSSKFKPSWVASDVLMFEVSIKPAIPAQKPQNA